MLNFRNSLIVYTLLLLTLEYLVAFHSFSLVWIVFLSVIFGGVISYGSARIESSFFVKAHCRGNSPARQIALTFDDGPTKLTHEVLDILRRHKVKATFFCIGQRVAQNPAIVQQVHKELHIIGNHTYSHSFFLDFFSTNNFHRELQLTEQAILQATGQRPMLFRPPYGVTTPGLAFAMQQHGYTCVGWNMRTMDTVTTDETLLLTRAVNALQSGTIFLFHDSVASTSRMLEAFIIEAHARGYEFVGVDTLLNIQPYA